MSSLRGSPRGADQPSGSSKYNRRFKSISSYIMERLPGFRRKTSVESDNDPSPRSDLSESLSDLPNRGNKAASQHHSSRSNSTNKFKAPHLLPSLSESHISHKNTTKSGVSTKSTKKILVSSSSTGYDGTSNNIKSGTKHESNRSKQSQSNRMQNNAEYSSSTVSASSSSSSSAQKKHSPTSPSQDYSSSTVDSDASARYNNQYPSQQYSHNLYRGGHSSITTTTSPNVIIFGNNNNNNTHQSKSNHSGEKADAGGTGRSTAATLLSQMGFPVGRTTSDTKSTPSSTASQIIPVKPAAQNTNTTNSSNITAGNSVDYRHSRSRAPTSSSSLAHSTDMPEKTPSTTASNNKATAATTPSVTTASSPVPAAAVSKTKLCCDKCDGKHLTEECPYYKKSREDHPDAQKNKQIGGVSSLPGNTLYTAKVVRQPGDGSCLFHSMSYGLPVKSNASRLRAEICQFIQNNPNLKISDTPLQDWVKWDANISVSDYARKMSRGSWGGGIEMACFSLVRSFNNAALIGYTLVFSGKAVPINSGPYLANPIPPFVPHFLSFDSFHHSV